MLDRVHGRPLRIAMLAVVLGGAIYWLRHAESPAPIQGVVRATEVRVAPEVGGHLAAVHVRKGERVFKGERLAELSAVELSAHSRGALSSRQRRSLAPWRMRPPLTWSKLTSTTSSGRILTHASSRPCVQRDGSPEPRSPVS